MQRSRRALLNRRALGISGRSRLYKVSLSLVFVLWGLVFLFSLWFSRGHGFKDGSTVSPVGISTWDEAKLDRDEHYDIQKETDLGYSSGGECTNGVETGGLNGEFFAIEGSKQHPSGEGSRQQDLAEGSLHRASAEGSIFHASAVDEQPEVVTAGSGVKLENDAPKNGRLPRAVPLGLDEFKSKTFSSKSKSGNGQAGGIKHRVEPGGAEYNYASAAKGAKVLAFNKEAKGASNILGKDKDKYLRNPCSAEEKFVDIELSEETLVDTIEIANLEHYSSNLKDFVVLGSLTYPTNEWVFLGNVTAANNKLVQRFVLQQPKWVRYIKLKLLSHYGSEFYCTLSIIELYGVDAVERMLEDLISVESNSFVSEGATVDQKPVPSHPDSLEVDEFYHDIVKESEPQYAAGGSNVNNDMMNSEVLDPVKEVRHQQVNRMPGDTVLKILMQKVRSLDFSLSVLERYLEESTSKYGSIFGEFDKDLGEKDTDLQKIREDIRNLVQSQEDIANDVHNLRSWQSLVTMQLNNLVRDNALLRSEVERVREKQISVDNKGVLIFLICIIFSLLALVRLFTEMAVSVYMALSVDRTTEKPRKFCSMSSSWLFLLVSCILVLFILSL
ncbi:SUN domain-containing protein 4-like [Pyrus communis]|uniref:SUN domain-containing protein 4-like n=1 Tax=Pyrus communis TaxID=23211 RepID=UPI0035BF8322